ncbi:hypothetical protein ACWDYH_06410 [Nocardia goodfellowii]
MPARGPFARVHDAAWYRSLVRRRRGPLPPERARARLSAYVYGNILTLASIALTTTGSIADGTAVALVAGTGATTFLAHVFAEFVAYTSVSGRPDPPTSIGVPAELRDAVPIASSATIPSVLLAAGWLGLFDTRGAQLLAGAVVVVRIATIPLIAQRLRGNRPGFLVLVAGLVIAAVATAIVSVKAAIGH